MVTDILAVAVSPALSAAVSCRPVMVTESVFGLSPCMIGSSRVARTPTSPLVMAVMVFASNNSSFSTATPFW